MRAQPPLSSIAREWLRIGCIGFGGPPTHVALLRDLCVERKGWMAADESEDAIAATNLLPGPASTQLAIFCAWRLRGRLGAVVGGLCFIVPGLIVILLLAALFLSGSPPRWVRGAGAGAGAAVAAVAVNAAFGLMPGSWRRVVGAQRLRWLAYLALGAGAAATLGPWLVLVLVACGGVEVTWRRAVGPLSYGGGFVIIPLMQADAVNHYHWMTSGQFLNAVALGQITPGPVVLTVAVVGYAARGLGGGLLASAVAFAPSFAFVLLGAGRFGRLRGNPTARAFLGGAGPAAIGAILGSAIPLAGALHETVALLLLRIGVVRTLLAAAAVGVVVALAGGPLPS